MNLLAIILAILPHDAHVVRDSVDCVEVNAMHDGEGTVVFRQVIGWEWSHGRHTVAGWRGMSDKTWQPPCVTWVDGQRLYVLRGRYWRTTHSQYDPEVVEREILYPCHRRGLFGEKP